MSTVLFLIIEIYLKIKKAKEKQNSLQKLCFGLQKIHKNTRI